MTGPWGWADAGGTAAWAGGLWFNGRHIEGGSGFPVDMSGGGGATLLPMADNTDVAQSIYVGGDQPVNLKPQKFVLRVTINEEADYWAFQEAKHYGRPFDIWFDWPWTDVWWVPGANAGQVTWRTGRKQPFGLVTGITQSTRPPKVYTETAAGAVSELTVITGGSPTTGEVKVLDTSGYQNIETFTDVIGTSFEYLKMRYSAMFLVVVTDVSDRIVEHNRVTFDVTMQEHRGGVYTKGDA